MGEKVKVVLDTNIWIAIFIKRVLSKEFSELLRKERIIVYTTEEILKEISRVLMYPKISEVLELSGVTQKDILQRIIENSTLVRPRVRLKVITEDPEDNRILDCALQANVHFIVSGDKHLLKLRRFRNTRIATPREFLDVLRK